MKEKNKYQKAIDNIYNNECHATINELNLLKSCVKKAQMYDNLDEVWKRNYLNENANISLNATYLKGIYKDVANDIINLILTSNDKEELLKIIKDKYC